MSFKLLLPVLASCVAPRSPSPLRASCPVAVASVESVPEPSGFAVVDGAHAPNTNSRNPPQIYDADRVFILVLLTRGSTLKLSRTRQVEVSLIAGTNLVLYHPPQSLSIDAGYRRSLALRTDGICRRDWTKKR